MADLLNRTKNVINSSQNIIIFTKGRDNEESYNTGLSLYSSLKKMGKNVKLNSDSEDNTYSILVNIEDKEIKEVSYDKKDGWLQFDLILEDGIIRKNDVVFQEPEIFDESLIDLIITIGIKKLPELGDVLEKKFKLFYELPILNIDNQEFNEKFGQFNLVKENYSLPAIVSELLQKPTLQKKSHVSEVLKNLSINDKIKIPILCLKEKDFSDLPKDLNHIIKELKETSPTFLLLWEQEGLLGGVMHSNIEKYLEVIEDNFSAQRKNQSVLFYEKNTNILNIKEKIINKIWRA